MQKHRLATKCGKKPPAYNYTGTIGQDGSPIGLPVGTRIKGELLPFRGDQAKLRPGQLVFTRGADGGTQVRFYRPAIIQQVVAIVRMVVLPKRAAWPRPVFDVGGKRL